MILGVFLLYVAAAAVPRALSPEGFRIAEFGRLPIRVNGRVQPLDSAARIGLLQIRGTVDVALEERTAWPFRKRRISATEWLLELLAKPDDADGRKIFPVAETALRGVLNLPSTGGAAVYFSFKELQPKLEELGKESFRINKRKSIERALWEQECLKLRGALVIYERLKNSVQPNSWLQQEARGKPIHYDFAALLAGYHKDLRAATSVPDVSAHGTTPKLDAATEERMRTFARPFAGVSAAAMLSVVPVPDRSGARDRWQNVGGSIVESSRTGQVGPPVFYFAAMSSAFAGRKPDVFNDQLAKYGHWLGNNRLSAEVSKARYESFYNAFQPFLLSLAVYVVAFALVAASLLRRSALLHRSGVSLAILAFTLHTAGLLFEMMLEGRPPVTNVYAVIIFAGWCVALIAGILERFLRNGMGAVAATAAAGAAIGGAHSLAPGGAAEMIRSLLSASFLLACFAAVIILWLQPRSARRPTHRALTRRGAEPAASR
jgi:hypothetical protein